MLGTLSTGSRPWKQVYPAYLSPTRNQTSDASNKAANCHFMLAALRKPNLELGASDPTRETTAPSSIPLLSWRPSLHLCVSTVGVWDFDGFNGSNGVNGLNEAGLGFREMNFPCEACQKRRGDCVLVWLEMKHLEPKPVAANLAHEFRNPKNLYI